MRSVTILSSLLLSFLVCETFGFATGFWKRRSTGTSRSTFVSLSASTLDDAVIADNAAETTNVPSWESLASNLKESPAEEPLLTLYRDTNGWCPFCERVWVALRVKGIPYRESLISLQNKPEWYKELVPTTLVPAVLFHQNENGANERKIVWESMDVLKALDESFPDTPKLVLDTPEFEKALEMNNQLQMAGFGYIYAARNESLTESDIAERRETFLEGLDALDTALGESAGPFCLGDTFTAVDACMIPGLERWRYQLPLTHELNILDGRPHLQAWFDAMDNYAPYNERVAGDEYSWTAVTSTFLRFFGGDTEKPQTKAGIERADAAAAKLAELFAEPTMDDPVAPVFVQEAARKLITNHEAVIKDCTNAEPLSQKDLPRGTNEGAADLVLRSVSSLLLEDTEDVIALAKTYDLSVPSDLATEAAQAARTVSMRLCVPRDMSRPAAVALRGVLATVANRLESM